MSHRNHLSRRDLYAYGFKGETWGDDRRALEAALWEMDQLERQTEYEYHRPTPSHPWTSGRSSAWRPSHHLGGPPNARYHDVQINRSNSDLYSISESGMTSLSSQSYARYNDDSTYFDGYQRDYAHRTYPSSHAVPPVSPEYSGSQTSQDYQSPQYASPLRSSNSNRFRGSVGISHSSNHQNHGFAPAMAHSRTSSYDPSHHPQYSYSSQHPPAQRVSTPGQLQMVTQRSGRNESPSPEHIVDPRHASGTPAPLNMMSPLSWSMIATEGTARSVSPSVVSSRGMYNQNLRDMGYVDTASRTSGYVESFDVRSSGEFYDSSDEEYISDGVASDDYYSGDSNPEESWEDFTEGSYDDDEDRNSDCGSDY
ncbi:hypothetical protein BYT27DRAFT_7191657 [Phlegmacium glaucopus]|nr:hypothetical protein BYT27DRAFT_7191657 [Phlegmacium glaucopus]